MKCLTAILHTSTENLVYEWVFFPAILESRCAMQGLMACVHSCPGQSKIFTLQCQWSIIVFSPLPHFPRLHCIVVVGTR